MLKYILLIVNYKEFVLKRVLCLTAIVFILVGCKSSGSSSSEKSLENEKVVVLVHGLNSGSSTWEDMSTPISKALEVADGSSIEIGMSIAIKNGEKCWNASSDEESLISCSDLSSIKGQNFFRKESFGKEQVEEEQVHKVDASNRVFGLNRGQFSLNFINWKLESSDDVVSKDEQKRSKFSKQRVFSVNFSNNNQLTYDAQGAQLAKAIENIKDITGVKNIILIGHSMGGLASRAYIQNENSSGVTKLITIDTPHLGGKTFSKLEVGAGYYIGGKNASINLAHDSKALSQLNDIDNVAGKYDGIEVYHLGYSDGLDGLDILRRGTYYDEDDGIVDIASQMGLDTLDPYRVIFSPVIKGDIKEYKNLLTGEKKSADEVVESGDDYGVSERSIDLSIAHTEVLGDSAYLNYVLKLIKKD